MIADLHATGKVLGATTHNMQTCPDVERLRRSFGDEGWMRLTQLKRKFDPENCST